MKRLFNKSNKSDSQNFHVLTSNEMLKVRGGSDTKPPSREKDFFDLEDTDD